MFDPPLEGIWLLLKDKNLAVAFSGGKDSLALLHYLKINGHILNARIHAVHINHMLRGEESERDETFCRRYCEENRIDFKTRTVNVSVSPLMKERGAEYAARKMRYEALRQERENSGYDYILTAHTMDDRLETFFTDLITGASVYTLGGIEAVSPGILRPFLSVTSEMVNEFLDLHKLIPIYDTTNGNLSYVRNMVRTYAPFLQSMKESVFRIQEESARLSLWLSERTARSVESSGDNFVEINRAALEEMSDAEQGYIIGKWVSRLCRGGKVHSGAIIKSLEDTASRRFSLPMGYQAEVSGESVRIFPAEWLKPFYYIKYPGSLSVEVKERGILVEFPEEVKERELIVRTRAKGDRFRGKKLKKLFSDIKLPLILRDRVVVVAAKDNEILWSEHLASESELDIKVRVNREK
ncbi:MAG: tRNA lysidine(34) synthetase TilS [Deferribacteraceae bacterium]|nr:tRNA lysidine(34) synthetase TilS [Deferribacteraceae bacterium]